MNGEKRNPGDPIENLAIGKIIEVEDRTSSPNWTPASQSFRVYTPARLIRSGNSVRSFVSISGAD